MIKKIAILSLIILTSCNGKEKKNEESKKEVPEALQDDTSEFKRLSKGNDNLTEELYQELVAKTPELKNLEDELTAFNPKETQDKFSNYDGKSSDYYRSATNYADAITDSLTKNKIIALIKKSNEKYFEKTAALSGLMKDIYEKNSSINDYHNILKIVLTIPIIEKYQNENLPNKTQFEEVIKNENKLIEKTKSVTPK